MRRVLFLSVAFCLLFAGAPVRAADALAGTVSYPDTVIELYTSQGCNSCPPADELLGELRNRDGLLALSFNVDYWDYLGWKDTLASHSNTDRQEKYRAPIGGRYVYTPQMIVAGRDHEVGADRSGVLRMISTYRNHSREVPLKARIEGDSLIVDVPAANDSGWLWVMDVDDARTVAIEKGENAGRQITYYNNVRRIERVGEWAGEAKTITLDARSLMEAGRDGCAVILQRDGYGPIIGAVRLHFAQTS